MPNRQFTTGELIAAGIGGVALGALGMALIRRQQPTAPSGAVLTPSLPVPSASTAQHVLSIVGSRGEGAPGTPIPSSIKAQARPLPKPPYPPPASVMRSFPTADALLASCPTTGEMDKIRSDFNIAFIPAPPPWSCTQGGTESSIMLTVYNSFRLLYALTFDTPMPPLGITRPYDWLRSLNLNWYFMPSSPEMQDSNGGGQDVVILTDGMDSPDLRSVLNPASGNGLFGYPALFMHEARHTVPGGAFMHTGSCSPGHDDPSLSFGGAWAVEYYFLEWLVNHTLPLGPASPITPRTTTFLSPLEQSMLDGSFLRGPNGRFCDEWAHAVSPPVTPASLPPRPAPIYMPFHPTLYSGR
jgi:hypothetical protein